jgi:H+/gluconate symporter-like permease
VGFGKKSNETIEFSNELDILHKHIIKNNLQVQKSDSFDKQCFFLEQHIGEENFKVTYKKMNIINIISGISALPIFIMVMVVCIYNKWIDKNFDVFGFIINNPALYIIPVVLLIITLILSNYYSILRKKLYHEIYPELKRKLSVKEVTFE